MEALTPMLDRYSVCSGETLRKVERLMSNGCPLSLGVSGTSGTG
jgi:hypothetical protein